MKLTYETGVATMVQFSVMSLLGIANGFNSVVTECRANSSECIGDIILALLFWMLTVGWFAVICFIGFSAQERRSNLLAKLLIAAELLIIMVALVNAKGHTDALSLVTSVTDIVLAIWVISLAFRLMRSKGKRITSRRRRRRSTSK
jgi:purine-cytosine permease-like protein